MHLQLAFLAVYAGQHRALADAGSLDGWCIIIHRLGRHNELRTM